jgi:hypothetical protein
MDPLNQCQLGGRTVLIFLAWLVIARCEVAGAKCNSTM